MSRKVFTAGEVLAAADVNSFLMDQTVMSFAGTAARGSAIPTPTAGMTTYREDINRLESYTGSQWTSPSDLVQIANFSFTNSAAALVDSVFTSAYTNYKVFVNISGTNTVNCTLGMRASGSTNTTANYTYGSYAIQFGGTTVSGASNQNGTTWFEGARIQAGEPSGTELTFYNPQLAIKTFVQATTTDTQISRTVGMFFNGTTQFDGFALTPTGGTITGNIRVYGIRN